MSAGSERQSALLEALAAEPDWQALLRHFDFNEGFALIFLFVESPENAAVCRAAITAHLRESGKGVLRLIAPLLPEEIQNLPYRLHKPVGLDKTQTLWVESVVPEGSESPERMEEWRISWRACFASLNQIRNTLQRSIPCALVFVVAPWVEQLVRNIAPDLWSIKSTIGRISLRVDSLSSEAPVTWESFRAQTDPALSPDPEFAEREAAILGAKPGHELAQSRILLRAAEGYLSQANGADAIRVLEEARKIQKAAGATHGDISRAVSLLGQAYQSCARWAEAEACFRDVLAADQEWFGPTSEAVSSDLTDLSLLLLRMERLSEAEPMMREAITIDEARYGPNHPSLGTDLNNLAELLKATGRWSEAEPIMRRALAIEEANYGQNHPRVAIRLNNLSRLLTSTDRHEEAEMLVRRALAIDEQFYGPDHPEVAIDLGNLALLLKTTNRLDEAEPPLRRALEIDERHLGPEHPNVALYLSNLAQLLEVTDRREEAEPLMRRALEIHEASYGPGHTAVGIDLNNLAMLLRATGRMEEAEPLMARALKIFEDMSRKAGYDAPGLPTVRRNYAQIAANLGWSEEKIRAKLAALAGGEAESDENASSNPA